MLEIVVCDDNERYLKYITIMLQKIIKEKFINGKVVHMAKDATSVREFLKIRTANVFFIDIDLKTSENGFELAKEIRERDKWAYIIFITGHLEFVLHSFKVKPFDFLPKPITQVIIEQCIINIYNDYVSVLKPDDDKVIDIKTANVVYRIKVKDIVYIEKQETKTIVHMAANTIQCSESLETIEKMLEDGNFVRCHKSFICNKRFICEVRFRISEIIFNTGQTCLIGRKYKKELVCLE